MANIILKQIVEREKIESCKTDTESNIYCVIFNISEALASTISAPASMKSLF